MLIGAVACEARMLKTVILIIQHLLIRIQLLTSDLTIEFTLLPSVVRRCMDIGQEDQYLRS